MVVIHSYLSSFRQIRLVFPSSACCKIHAMRLRGRQVLVIVGLAAAIAWADSPIQWRGSRGWEPESSYCRLYDARHVETVKGVIERVEKITPMKGMGYGVYLMLKTTSESVPVHLGPKEFVEKQSIQLQTGDSVEVTGSRVSCDGKPAFLAAIVKRGSDLVKYRELNGRPAWAATPAPKP